MASTSPSIPRRESLHVGGRQEFLPGVTWVHSYVSEDLRKTWCVYDAPNLDAIREVAQRNNLPIDHIESVRVLDPYFYKS